MNRRGATSRSLAASLVLLTLGTTAYAATFSEEAGTFEKGSAADRVTVADAWAKKRVTAAVPLLSKALASDGDGAVRKKSAFALGAIGSKSGVGALTTALGNDRASDVRLMAAWALGRLGASSAVGALTRAAAQDNSMAVRIQALKSLTGIGDRSAVSEIKKLLKDRAKPIRTATIVALQRFGLSDSEIRGELPAGEQGGVLTAEKKSQGTGVALGLVGAGLIYAGKPVLGWTTLGAMVAGVGMLAAGLAGGALDTRTECPGGGLPPCGGLPIQVDQNPGAKGLFIGGAILAAGAWLTSVIGTPIFVTKYNKRIDDAKRSAFRIEPFFNLGSSARVFGARVRF